MLLYLPIPQEALGCLAGLLVATASTYFALHAYYTRNQRPTHRRAVRSAPKIVNMQRSIVLFNGYHIIYGLVVAATIIGWFRGIFVRYYGGEESIAS